MRPINLVGTKVLKEPWLEFDTEVWYTDNHIKHNWQSDESKLTQWIPTQLISLYELGLASIEMFEWFLYHSIHKFCYFLPFLTYLLRHRSHDLTKQKTIIYMCLPL